MISLNTSGRIRISEIAKVLSKYPINSNIQNNTITLSGKIPRDCIDEIVGLGIELSSISTSEHKDITVFDNRTSLPHVTGNCHATLITQSSKEQTYQVLYSSPKYGEIYWVDFGSPFGYEEAYIRPALVVKNDGVFNAITTVIPFSSKTERYQDTSFTPIFVLSDENMSDYNPFSKLSYGKPSCLLVEQIRTVDKSRLRGYIGTLEPNFMCSLMKNVKTIFETDYEAVFESTNVQEDAVSSF